MQNPSFKILPGNIVPSEKKKILFATVPADGHFNPLTGLAKTLVENGYEIGWYTAASYSRKLNKLGIRHFPFKKALEVTGSNIEEVFPERKEITNPIKKLNFDIINFFILRSEEYYTDIKEIYQGFPFDLFVCDVAFTAIPFISDKMNLPVISIGVFPLTESSSDLPPAGIGITPSYSGAGKLKQNFLRYVADKILFKKANAVMRHLLSKHGISHGNTNVFDMLGKKSTLLLQTGTPGFEYYRSDLGKNIRFLGALLPDDADTTQWFDDRLNKYEKIVLVTQGTVEKNTEKLLVPTLEAFINTDVLVIATTGGSNTNELKTRFPQKNFIIEDFIPFGDVMPYADVYVTNGGYGGVLLSIQNGVPMVMAGIHEGKNEINARVGYFDLGINLKTENPKPAIVRAAVEQIFTDTKYRENVLQLGEEFSMYDPHALALQYIEETIQLESISKINVHLPHRDN